ncbi:unnamed protein product, partial [Rhizoctonia solani]
MHLYITYITNSAGAPSQSIGPAVWSVNGSVNCVCLLCLPFTTGGRRGCLCIGPALLPDETGAGLDEAAFLNVEAAGYRGVDTEQRRMEYAVGICSGADMYVGASRLLGLHRKLGVWVYDPSAARGRSIYAPVRGDSDHIPSRDSKGRPLGTVYPDPGYSYIT